MARSGGAAVHTEPPWRRRFRIQAHFLFLVVSRNTSNPKRKVSHESGFCSSACRLKSSARFTAVEGVVRPEAAHPLARQRRCSHWSCSCDILVASHAKQCEEQTVTCPTNPIVQFRLLRRVTLCHVASGRVTSRGVAQRCAAMRGVTSVYVTLRCVVSPSTPLHRKSARCAAPEGVV